MNDEIPIAALTADKSTITGSIDNFIHPCKPEDEHALVFSDAQIKTHQVIVSFDAIYPIDHLILTQWISELSTRIDTISIDLSLNGVFYTRLLNDVVLNDETTVISLSGESARFIRFVFPAEKDIQYGIQDIRFYLADGLIVKEDLEWTSAFLRYDTWTGADGVFSFNLNGNDAIGASFDTTAFIFSDTMVGPVNPMNGLRQSNRMINNSLAYYDGTIPVASGLTFVYGYTDDQTPQSPFLPDAYIGYQANNLLDSDGLSAALIPEAQLGNDANGISWLASNLPGIEELILDFGDLYSPKNVFFWNYNENPDYGVEELEILTSIDKVAWSSQGFHSISKASGSSSEPYTLRVTLADLSCRYLKIKVHSGYDTDRVGLGKLLVMDQDSLPLFGSLSATSQVDDVTGNELSSRLWLQDGIVLGDYIYLFPLLVKDEDSLFKVTRIGMMKVPIVDARFDFLHTTYFSTPLMSKTPDGGKIYFGAGLMNHVMEDGYVYIYGYKDLDGRHLIVGRFHPEDVENFNEWTYYDGSVWSKNPNDAATLIEGVSPELSVTPITSGKFAGKYMLVAEEGTTSGRIVYALADHPEGPFEPFQLLYQTTEHVTLRGGMTYNAKMHPHLSSPGNYLISYNVNTTILSALVDVNIYHPRFIRVIEVKKP